MIESNVAGILYARRCVVACLIAFSSAAASDGRGGEFDAEYGVPYVERDSVRLKADLYVPRGEGPFPGVLVVHGGAWRMGTRAQLTGVAQKLAQRGFTAVAISYRLAPQHKFPAQIDDCKTAVRWMRQQCQRLKMKPDRIGGSGYSAGAQLVALLCATDADDGLEGVEDPAAAPSTRIQAAAVGGLPSEFRTLAPDGTWLSFWLGGTRREKPDLYRLASPRAFVTPDDPPLFMFHGETDRIVPMISPVAMHEALVAAGVPSELYVAPQLDHNAVIYDSEAVDRALDFLEKHLKAETGP